MESLSENWLDDIASMFQVHERCFISFTAREFELIEMRNRAVAHLKTAFGPRVVNHMHNEAFSLVL